MSKTITQLQKQIAKLQQQAEELRRKEIDEVVGRIREAIAHYGLTAADLGLSANGSSRGRRSVRATRRRTSGVKFRDESGNTWTGRGRRPRWYVDAIAAGKTPQDLSV